MAEMINRINGQPHASLTRSLRTPGFVGRVLTDVIREKVLIDFIKHSKALLPLKENAGSPFAGMTENRIRTILELSMIFYSKVNPFPKKEMAPMNEAPAAKPQEVPAGDKTAVPVQIPDCPLIEFTVEE